MTFYRSKALKLTCDCVGNYSLCWALNRMDPLLDYNITEIKSVTQCIVFLLVTLCCQSFSLVKLYNLIYHSYLKV